MYVFWSFFDGLSFALVLGPVWSLITLIYNRFDYCDTPSFPPPQLSSTSTHFVMWLQKASHCTHEMEPTPPRAWCWVWPSHHSGQCHRSRGFACAAWLGLEPPWTEDAQSCCLRQGWDPEWRHTCSLEPNPWLEAELSIWPEVTDARKRTPVAITDWSLDVLRGWGAALLRSQRFMHISGRHTSNLNTVRALFTMTTQSHCCLEDKANWTHVANEFEWPLVKSQAVSA